MNAYFKSRKLDITTADPLVVLLHEDDATKYGFVGGQIVELNWRDLEIYVLVNLTNTELNTGEIGLYEDLWDKYDIPADEIVTLDMIDSVESIEYIRKKIQGHKLNEKEIDAIMSDISLGKIREVEVAYFMSCFFNPGFDEEETVNIAKSMARFGDILDFKNLKKEGKIIIDKHSIGGIAGKGVTPIIVPIVASTGLIVPNTSTRAITTPAGTSDILEVIIPVSLTVEKVIETVEKEGACMIWGGSLQLAPADDILITVEKNLHLQSQMKFLASIIAKKISMGLDRVLIDIPYGKEAKMKDADSAEKLSRLFVKLFKQVGIECETYIRFVEGPDCRGIGPVLEIVDILKVLEQTDDRPLMLEELALDMAGKVLEMGGKAKDGQGKKMAKEILTSGKALKKFWSIAKEQGATEIKKYDSLKAGEYSRVYKSEKSGKIKHISNELILKVCRSLGTPAIKQAGLYFHKTVGEVVKKGDDIITVYATSYERLENGCEKVDLDKMFTII